MTTHIISIEECPSGFKLVAQDKPPSTPLGKAIVLPTRKMAEAIAGEWQAQGRTIRRDTMPLTGIACVALDLVPQGRDAIHADILSYTDTDLICYRAGDTPELHAEQKKAFDPLLTWITQQYGVELETTDGIMPLRQVPQTHSAFTQAVAGYDEWRLAVLASVLRPLSSLVLALALTEGKIDATQAFELSYIEEEFETRKWGKDEEKEERLARLKRDIAAAGHFLKLLG